MRHADHDAHRAFEASSLHPGCTGDCADGAPCCCSHSQAWRAPRQPRKPEPRTPHLPLWTRVRLAWPRWLAGVWRDILAVAMIGAGAIAAVTAIAIFAAVVMGFAR